MRRLWPWAWIIGAVLALAGCASSGDVAKCIAVLVDCRPATRVAYRNGACVCLPLPSPSPSASPTPVPTPSPIATPTPAPTPGPTPTPAPLPTPGPIVPTPVPTPPPDCVAMPASPVSVRGSGGPGWYRFDNLAFAPSSCEAPGENLKCFRGQPNGEAVEWPADELSCWALGPHTERELRNQGRHLVTHAGKTMVCPVSDYPDGGVGSLPHCWDAWGRRVEMEGGAWRETGYPADRFTGWYHQLCPPRVCTPGPVPTPTPGPAPTPGPTPAPCVKLPECAENKPEDAARGIFGCCRMVESWGAWSGPSQFRGDVEAELDAMIAAAGTDVVFRPDDPDPVKEAKETAFTSELARRLRGRGLCATTRGDTPGGGTSDEVGVRNSPDRSEQHDVILSGGKVRRNSYVAVCKPARF